VLIFTQMTRVLDILEDYCRWRQFKYCRIDGSTAQVDRDEAMDSYNAKGSEKFVFLLSTRAGGLGINLQTADTVVLYDSDWNPQMDLQAQDRAHRIGQKKQVRVFRMVTEGTIEEKIVERALSKLYLDALVIRQGGMNHKKEDKSKNKVALQSMIRFGAELIFKGTGSMITDEDIDAILAKGMAQTDVLNGKIKEQGNNNLANFKLSDASDRSVLQWEGKDFSAMRKQDGSFLHFIEPPKRESKALVALRPIKKKTTVKRVFKPLERRPYQFFNVERLVELEEQEFNAMMELRVLKKKRADAVRERKYREKKAAQEARRAARRAANAAAEDSEEEPEEEEPEEDSDDESPSAGVADANAVIAKSGRKERANVKNQAAAQAAASANGGANGVDVDEEEEVADYTDICDASDAQLKKAAKHPSRAQYEEMAGLKEEGFRWMTRNILQELVRSMAAHGRNSLDAILADMAYCCPPAVVQEDVTRYHRVFWSGRHKEIPGWEKLIASVEKGEARIVDLKNKNELLQKKAGGESYYGIYTFQYPYEQTEYTPEEDSWLVRHVAQAGYGNWDDITWAIKHAWEFRFDWFMKSRTVDELKTRVKFLVRVLEAEQRKQLRKASSSSRKRKAAPSPSPSSSSPSASSSPSPERTTAPSRNTKRAKKG
jgi:SWI/SNF-related matrix-associated actin-dependent regulator of chromatin subfamily A member 5